MKISVVTATRNCVDTVLDTLCSVQSQGYANVEHVVVDGASSDGTLEALQSSRSSLGALLSEPDEGIYDALNKGIGIASGQVVGFLHADDVYGSSEVLSEIASVFENPEVQAVYGDLEYVRADDLSVVVRHWRSCEFTPQRLLQGWMPPHPTLYVRKEWYDLIGGFNTSYRIAADYLSILQLFSHADLKTVYLPKVVVKMRIGGVSNRSLKNIIRKSSEDYRALKETGVGGLGTLAFKNVSKIGQFFHREVARQ